MIKVIFTAFMIIISLYFIITREETPRYGSIDPDSEGLGICAYARGC